VFLSDESSWWPEAINQLGTVGEPLANTISVFPLSRLTGTPLAVGITGGPYAAGLEKSGSSAMTAAVIKQLRSGFGTAAAPLASEQTNWLADPFSRGSYSYLGPNSSYADRLALGKLNRRLILAGEHTSVDRPATMDGAWLAGKTAARRLASELR
jgi:monoamine oxidase